MHESWKKVILSILSLVSLSFGQSYANQISEMTYRQKLTLSNLVIIGRVNGIVTSNSKNLGNNVYATVSIQKTIKGKSVPVVKVMIRGMIPENEPKCCDRGGTYLFFLLRQKSNEYVSTNGRFGIYKMENDKYR